MFFERSTEQRAERKLISSKAHSRLLGKSCTVTKRVVSVLGILNVIAKAMKDLEQCNSECIGEEFFRQATGGLT